MRIYILILLLLGNFNLFCQSDSTKSSSYYSVEVNQLIRQVLSLGNPGVVNNPYVFTYSKNKPSGRGFGIGLGYSVSGQNSERNSFDGQNLSRSFDFRIGTDRKVSLSEKIIFSRGLDIIFGRSVSITKTKTDFGNNASTTVETNNKSFEYGFGPRFGFICRLHKNVWLSTEMTSYLSITSGKNKLSTTNVFPVFDPITGQQTISKSQTEDITKIKGYSIFLNLPTALFITLYYRK